MEFVFCNFFLPYYVEQKFLLSSVVLRRITINIATSVVGDKMFW